MKKMAFDLVDDSRDDDSSRSSHRDWGSTALVDILQWLDHFEPWQTQLRPATRPPMIE